MTTDESVGSDWYDSLPMSKTDPDAAKFAAEDEAARLREQLTALEAALGDGQAMEDEIVRLRKRNATLERMLEEWREIGGPPSRHRQRADKLQVEAARLREDNQRLESYLRDGQAMQDEIERLTGVIEQIRAQLAELTAEAEATTDPYDKRDALSDFAVLRSWLPSTEPAVHEVIDVELMPSAGTEPGEPA